MYDWKPIDTLTPDVKHALRNDTPEGQSILLSGTNGMCVVYWDGYDLRPDGCEATYDMTDVVLDIGRVTHWTTLPPKP